MLFPGSLERLPPLLSLLLAFGSLVHGDRALAEPPSFRDPRPVEIKGLPAGSNGGVLSTEEPFISGDGRFLFFNSGEKENNKDLHFAESHGSWWRYRGPLGPGVNTPKDVQGAPSMDGQFRLYFTDSSSRRMIRRARFIPTSGELASMEELPGIPEREVRLFRQEIDGNMDVEVSPDGSMLFLSRATWDLNLIWPGRIERSDLLFLQRQEKQFVLDEGRSKRILERINTDDLEYAASISGDGLELFFTRLLRADLKAGRIRSRILVARRKASTEPFGEPSTIEAIGGADFVEGPSLSGDGTTLYYHKREEGSFRIYRVVRPATPPPLRN